MSEMIMDRVGADGAETAPNAVAEMQRLMQEYAEQFARVMGIDPEATSFALRGSDQMPTVATLEAAITAMRGVPSFVDKRDR